MPVKPGMMCDCLFLCGNFDKVTSHGCVYVTMFPSEIRILITRISVIKNYQFINNKELNTEVGVGYDDVMCNTNVSIEYIFFN